MNNIAIITGATGGGGKIFQELIEKVIVKAPEHVEIVWKFKDEVRKFIEI